MIGGKNRSALRVVVASARPEDRARFEEQLHRWGMHCTLVEEARDMVTTFSRAPLPDVAIIDRTLLGTDTIQLFRGLRRSLGGWPSHIMLDITHAHGHDPAEAIDQGADDVLMNNTNVGELEARLLIATRTLHTRREVQRARYAAVHPMLRDRATGVTTRTFLMEQLHLFVDRTHERDEPFALLLLEPTANEALRLRHGMERVSEASWELVRRVHHRLRPYDLVAVDEHASLAVLLDPCDADEALTIGEDLLAQMSQSPVWFGDLRLDLRCSVGVATTQGLSPSLTASSLYSAASRALSQAHMAGGGMVTRVRADGTS